MNYAPRVIPLGHDLLQKTVVFFIKCGTIQKTGCDTGAATRLGGT